MAGSNSNLAFRIRAGAAAAVMTPLIFGFMSYSVYGQIVMEQWSSWGFGRRSMAVAALAVAILELRWLGDLVALVRSRGRSELVVAWRTTPTYLVARMRRRRVLCATGLGVFLALAIGETIFRALDIRPPPRPLSGLADYFAVDNSLNILGLREDWEFISPHDPRLQILFLGDSIVYGDGVERDECFCRFVQQIISPDIPSGVLTINAGFRGTDPGRQWENFRRIQYDINPRIILHVVYPNDLAIDMHRRLDEIYRIRDGDLWVGDESRLLCFAERQIRFHLAWNRAVDYLNGGADEKREAAWAKLENDLIRCKTDSHQRGAVYAIVMFPWLVRLDDYPLTAVHARMETVARRLNVPYLDLLPTFAGRDAEMLRVSLANEHPNVEGHRIAAERIAEFLRAEVLPSIRH